ncbi:hypothetical protein [Acinetobacter sp.]|uniref:hypothetical protein n=1 Tax=Acinetobacter sp. TaxID=472 RepID=UPI002FD9B9D7
MRNYSIKFPDDFNEYEWEIESKGCLEIDIEIYGNIYNFNFYDPIRLNQKIQDDLYSNPYSFYENLVVISSVNVENIEYFIEDIIDTPYLSSFNIKGKSSNYLYFK